MEIENEPNRTAYLNQLEEAVANPEKFWSDDPSVQISAPIGTIVAMYLPPLTLYSLPIGWLFCWGQVCIYDGPFKDKNVPDLRDNRFLMGARENIGGYGGSNSILPDGHHSHGGTTSEASKIYDGCDSGSDRYPTQGFHTHTFTTNNNGEHNHGGDNRPSFFGVIYIIKVA